MRKFADTLLVLVLIVFGQLTAQAQTTGSIAGTVVDPNGAVIPNAAITVTGESGTRRLDFRAARQRHGVSGRFDDERSGRTFD